MCCGEGAKKRRHHWLTLGYVILQQGREGAKVVEEAGGTLVTFSVTGPSSVCSQNSAPPRRTGFWVWASEDKVEEVPGDFPAYYLELFLTKMGS